MVRVDVVFVVLGLSDAKGFDDLRNWSFPAVANVRFDRQMATVERF
jgi:hypothetical protein